MKTCHGVLIDYYGLEVLYLALTFVVLLKVALGLLSWGKIPQ